MEQRFSKQLSLWLRRSRASPPESVVQGGQLLGQRQRFELWRCRSLLQFQARNSQLFLHSFDELVWQMKLLLGVSRHGRDHVHIVKIRVALANAAKQFRKLFD